MKTSGSILALLFFCWLNNAWSQTIAIGEHSLIICSDGTVKSWGYNSSGQLGIGSQIDTLLPVSVDSLTHVIAVISSADNALALRSDSTVWAWGANYSGGIGLGSLSTVTTPTQIPNLQGIIAISSQWWYHSMMLKSDGTVWTTGWNQDGELGDTNLYSPRTVPGQVMNLNNVTAIAAGHDFSLALRNDSTVWAWGSNYESKLGIDTNPNTLACECRPIPAQVRNLNHVIAIAAGESYGLALRSDSTIWSWGKIYSGLLGDSLRLSPFAEQIPGLTGVIAISARPSVAMALKSDGTVWVWGSNTWGQLGVGDTTLVYRASPMQIPTLTNVCAIATGGRHGMALKNDGTVWNWGSNYGGEMGNGTIDSTGCYCELTNAPHQVMNLCYVLPCHLTTSTISIAACDSYTSPSGNYIWNASGVYMDTLLNATGCDSLITVLLTINHADTSIAQNGNVLTANGIGTYQWLDCNAGYATIAGAVSQNFTSVVNGSYAASITQNGCTDTSSCYAIEACSAFFTLSPDTAPHVWIALNLANGVSPISCAWNWGDGNTSSGSSPSHTYASPDYYNICMEITDSNGCHDIYCDSSTYISLGASTAIIVTVNVVVPGPVGINELLNSCIQVAPNPARSLILISIPLDRTIENKFEIYDLTGKRMIEKIIASGSMQEELNISDWPQGIYLFKMNTRNGVIVKKIVKVE